jgi:hypothetical protein
MRVTVGTPLNTFFTPNRSPRMLSLPLHVFLRRGLAGALTAATALLWCASSAQAAYISTVFASGLNNPRGLAFSPDGSLHVAEAGVAGGSGPSTEVRGVTTTLTDSGSITQVKDGVQTRVTTGLPSLWGADVTGPNGVSFDASGKRYVTIGAGIDPAVRSTDLAPGGSALGRLESEGRSVDVAAYETANNPGGGLYDSNPWRAVAVAGGMLVTDAGANALLRVADDGSISLVARFDRLIAPPPFGFPTDAVPTGLAVGLDGAYYVGFLTGFPFTPGAAQVLRVTADGDISVYASGFTNVIDLAFGSDGSLYVLEFDHDGMQNPGTEGALLRVGTDGSQSTIFSAGLFAPTGLAIGPDGAFYVSSLDANGIGQVLRIAEVPEPPTLALVAAALWLAVGLGVRRRRALARQLR